MDWETCKRKKIAKEIKVNKNLIKSLLESSHNKLNSQSLLKLNDTTSASKISLTYEALRELLEALAISKGYKIYNYECYCYFLKEILNRSSLANKFDIYRKIRNDINYYGKKINKEEGKEVLEELINIIKEIKKLF